MSITVEGCEIVIGKFTHSSSAMYLDMNVTMDEAAGPTNNSIFERLRALEAELKIKDEIICSQDHKLRQTEHHLELCKQKSHEQHDTFQKQQSSLKEQQELISDLQQQVSELQEECDNKDDDDEDLDIRSREMQLQIKEQQVAMREHQMNHALSQKDQEVTRVIAELQSSEKKLLVHMMYEQQLQQQAQEKDARVSELQASLQECKLMAQPQALVVLKSHLTQMRAELDNVKQLYFYSVALSIKQELASKQESLPELSTQALYHGALSNQINYKLWPQWIQQQLLNTHATP